MATALGPPIQAEQADEWLTGLAERIASPQAAEPLRKWVDEVAGDIGAGFQSSRTPGGVPWAALKNPRPQGHNPGSRPLIDFGDLMLSVISRAAGNIEEITDDSAKWGTSHTASPTWNTAAIHQYGAPRANIPARPFIGVNQQRIDSAIDLLKAHLIQRFAA